MLMLKIWPILADTDTDINIRASLVDLQMLLLQPPPTVYNMQLDKKGVTYTMIKSTYFLKKLMNRHYCQMLLFQFVKSILTIIISYIMPRLHLCQE